MTAVILDRITHHARRMLALNRGSKSDRRKGSNLDRRKHSQCNSGSQIAVQVLKIFDAPCESTQPVVLPQMII